MVILNNLLNVNRNCPLYIFEKVVFERRHKEFLDAYHKKYDVYMFKPKCNKVFSIDDAKEIGFLDAYNSQTCTCSDHIPYSPDNIGDFMEEDFVEENADSYQKWYS